MFNKGQWKHVVLGFILFMLWLVPTKVLKAQQLSLEIELSPVLENSEVLSLTGLGLNEKGSGPVLISAFLENLTDEPLDNLYLKMSISAAKLGTIIDLTQKNSRPFTLHAGQSVYATNNDLANERIPGIEEKISFNGGLTAAGDELISNLGGSTALPKDVYTVELTVFRDNLSNPLASASAEVGGNASAFDDSEIYLKMPGDVVQAEAEIVNPYPQFSWEGQNNTTYRLIVVQANGEDSPESLLQSAKSTEPIDEGGGLLQFENLDVLVEGSSYQFPASGVQPLRTGELYYWQVLTTIRVSRDTEIRSSEIWSFRLTNNDGRTVQIPDDPDVIEALIELLGEEQYNRLNDSGFKLEGLEVDGQLFDGAVATQQLELILEKIRDGEIILNN